MKYFRFCAVPKTLDLDDSEATFQFAHKSFNTNKEIAYTRGTICDEDRQNVMFVAFWPDNVYPRTAVENNQYRRMFRAICEETFFEFERLRETKTFADAVRISDRTLTRRGVPSLAGDDDHSFTVVMPEGKMFTLDLTSANSEVRRKNLAVVDQQCESGRVNIGGKKTKPKTASIFLVHRYLDYLDNPGDEKNAAVLMMNADYIKENTGAIGAAYAGDLRGEFACRFVFDKKEFEGLAKDA